MPEEIRFKQDNGLTCKCDRSRRPICYTFNNYNESKSAWRFMSAIADSSVSFSFMFLNMSMHDWFMGTQPLNQTLRYVLRIDMLILAH